MSPIDPAAGPAPHSARRPASAPDGWDAPDGSEVRAAKAALRTRVRAARRAMDPSRRAAEAEAAAAHLWEWLGPRVDEARAAGAMPVVATVLPMPTEPDTGPLRTRLHAAGARVLVPVIAPERGLEWAQWHPDVALARAAAAPIDEPVGPRHGADALDAAVAVVLPGLAVAEDGLRLGQGGGYYDRFLAGLPATVPTVALLYAHELLPAGQVPAEPTDRRVDGVVTAAGLRWLPAA